MDGITIIEGSDLDHLCDMLGVPKDARPYRLRIWQAADGSAVKIKVAEGMWSPAIGKEDR